MHAFKNLAHGLALAVWILLGVAFSLSVIASPALPGVMLLKWWLWFGGYAALTTAVVRQASSFVGPTLIHLGAVIALSLLPRVVPFSWLRLGIDYLFAVL